MRTIGLKLAGAGPPVLEYPNASGYSTRPMAGAVTVNSAKAYVGACLAGLGLIQAPRTGVVLLLDNGSRVAKLLAPSLVR